VNDLRVAVFSSSWLRAPQSEIAVAHRSIAGALSRLATVDVYVPGEGGRLADGAFEVTPVGATVLPGARRYEAGLVEAGDGGGSIALAHAVLGETPSTPLYSIGRSPEGEATRMGIGGVLGVGLGDDGQAEDQGRFQVHPVGLYARIHPGASTRRHYGLGSVRDYLLVLGDRTGVPVSPWPSERARWLLARFPREYAVTVEGGVARAWRSRSCVAQFEVHTRMDLWILMARANGVVDLLPGDVYARECVESLRYGVPVVVPDGSAAAGVARAGGGLRFSTTSELLTCVEAIADPPTRAALATAGRKAADRWYGDPAGLVSRLGSALGLHERTQGHGR